MDVLFPTDLVDGKLNKESAAKAISRVLTDWLSAGSITEPDVTVTVAELSTDLATIKHNINHWNENLYKTFRHAVEELDEICDTQKTFDCKIAARDIDNDWNPLSRFAILSDHDNNPNFVNTCVNDYNKDEVLTNPKNYAIAVCSVNVKE